MESTFWKNCILSYKSEHSPNLQYWKDTLDKCTRLSFGNLQDADQSQSSATGSTYHGHSLVAIPASGWTARQWHDPDEL